MFVTFEGGDGSGKSTQLRRIAARFEAAGHPPVTVREPGGTPLAEGARALLLDGEHRLSPVTEVFLVEAARSDLMKTIVQPALAEGRVVLCDRHTDSTLAYQGAGRGVDLELLRALNRAAAAGIVPDLTLLYDVDPAVGLARRASASGTRNRLDREPIEFHAKVRQGFLALARAEPERIVVLDGSLESDVLEQQSWGEIETRWKAQRR